MAKSHLGNGNPYGKTKVSAFCIQLLVDLYVAATPKSPFKCAIARFVFQLLEFCVDSVFCIKTFLAGQ